MGMDISVHSDVLRDKRPYILRSLASLLMLCVLILLIWGVSALFRPDTLPIRHVQIEGDFTRLSPMDLRQLVADKAHGTFFNLNVDDIRSVLIAEPWVSKVVVNRVWPDTLYVLVIERVPVARFGASGLLTADGTYFQPQANAMLADLPLLTGEIGTEQILLNQLNNIKARLIETNLQIASLSLDERRSWSMTLINGVTVIFGRQDFEDRLRRFLLLSRTFFAARKGQIDVIDMRYTNGFAVRWKQ